MDDADLVHETLGPDLRGEIRDLQNHPGLVQFFDVRRQPQELPVSRGLDLQINIRDGRRRVYVQKRGSRVTFERFHRGGSASKLDIYLE
jgi:hypothetical protein